MIPPEAVVNVARCTMGGIDLDVHSTPEANRFVTAGRFLDATDDLEMAIGRHWSPAGNKRVLLAIPGGLRLTRALLGKLLKEYRSGAIREAVAWCGSNEALVACPWLWDFPICLPWRRLAPRFWDDELEQCTRVLPADWSPIIYLPPPDSSDAFRRGVARFHASASPYGRIVLDEWSGESRWQECYEAANSKPYPHFQ